MELIDPKVLDRIGSYELLSRSVVEGYISGLHRSMFHGFGTEFVQYRNYVPGDDLKYVDWKVYARTKKLCTKVFREETNMNCRIVLDCSASMAYQGSKSQIPKLKYSAVVSACLAYLISRQGDKVGFYAYANEILSAVPPGSSKRHLHEIFRRLNKLKAEGSGEHRQCLTKISEGFKGRGLVIFISDMMEGEDEIMRFLKSSRFSHNDCVLLHVLDDDELNFPFDKNTRFVGMEDNEELITAPQLVREQYLENLNKHIDKIKTNCRANGVDYTMLNTSEDLDFALASYLNKRAEMR